MHADNMHNFLTQKSCSELSKVVSLGLILTVINSYVFQTPRIGGHDEFAVKSCSEILRFQSQKVVVTVTTSRTKLRLCYRYTAKHSGATVVCHNKFLHQLCYIKTVHIVLVNMTILSQQANMLYAFLIIFQFSLSDFPHLSSFNACKELDHLIILYPPPLFPALMSIGGHCLQLLWWRRPCVGQVAGRWVQCLSSM